MIGWSAGVTSEKSSAESMEYALSYVEVPRVTMESILRSRSSSAGGGCATREVKRTTSLRRLDVGRCIFNQAGIMIGKEAAPVRPLTIEKQMAFASLRPQRFDVTFPFRLRYFCLGGATRPDQRAARIGPRVSAKPTGQPTPGF